MKEKTSKKLNKKISRRSFLKSSAFVGGSCLLYTKIDAIFSGIAHAHITGEIADFAYTIQEPENMILSTCLQCHPSCQIKGKLMDGLLVKLDGNAYSPQNYLPHIPYKTDLRESAILDGKLCPKGLAGIQTLYDPYRIRKVLKRTGPRGSNKWKTISFDQALNEIVEGGKLFKDIGENQHVEGLNDIFALRDAALAKKMEADVAKIRKKKMTVEDFKSKYADNLNVLIDPDHPDIGPKNNQFVFMAGRIQHGRKELGKRFTFDAFCSSNFFEHTTICEQSHHIAYYQATSPYKKGKWGKGKTHMKPNLLFSDFVIYWGTGAFEANFGSNYLAEKVTRSLRERNFQYAVIDPRLSKTAATAKYWLPVNPDAGDGALAMGMLRWIIENERYDKRYLTNANKAAAKADKEPTWTNATYLVKIEKGGRPGALLRASDVALGTKVQLVVSKNGTLTAVTPTDESSPVEGDLLVETESNGIKLKSSFQLLKESAMSKSMDEYSKISGIERSLTEAVANEFTSHGKKVAIDFYRGAVQHTNGYYTGQAIIALNLMVGCPDWKGGLTAGGGHWHEFGGKPGNVYNFKKLHPNKMKYFGVPITREKVKYDESTLFAGYPAKRPWYPLSSNVYQEIVPSADESYPYPVKALFLHMGSPIISSPAGDKIIDTLRDTKKIPLFFTCDILVGETSMYADYIFPDLSFLERWGTPHVSPDIIVKISKIRQPVVAPLTEIVNVGGVRIPLSLEALLLAIAKKLKLSGFGKDGFGKGMNFDWPEEYYLKLAANLAAGDKKGEMVPDADDYETDIFQKARRHLPKTVYDLKRWKGAVMPDIWRKVLYVLNRGGRFEDYDKAYKGPYLAHQFKKMFNIYAEPVATTKNSMTGKYFSGTAKYEPIANCRGERLNDDGYDFTLITFKEIFEGHSRTIPNYWSNSILPANHVWINKRDAQRLGIKNGEYLRLVSKSNPNGKIDLRDGRILDIKGKAEVMEGIRPGVVAASWHYGHWAYGSNDIVVDGKTIKGDKRRATGVAPNPIMRVDEHVKLTGLTDQIGASSSFYDTKVRLEKV